MIEDQPTTPAARVGAARVPVTAIASELLDRVEAAVMIVALDGTVLYANPYCQILYGLRPEQLVGRPAVQLSVDPISTETRAEIAGALATGHSWEGAFRVRRRDGTTIDVHAIDSPVLDPDGTMTAVVTLAFDATEEQRAQYHLRRMLAVIQILRDIGETVVTGLDLDRVTQTVSDASRRLTFSPFATFVRRLSADQPHEWHPVPPDAPMLRRALTSDAPTIFDDTVRDGLFPNELVPVLHPDGAVRSCLVAPVRSRAGDLTGALVLGHPDPEHYSADDAQVVGDIAAQAGVVLDIARILRAAEKEIEVRGRAEDEQRFLAETSALLSWSLDYPATFERLARLCVPFLGDLCLIDVAGERGIRRVTAVHADEARAEQAGELLKHYAPDPYGRHPAANVLAGGASEYATEITDDFLRATTRDERHYRLVKELGFESYIAVPLTARGRTIGCMTLVSAGSGRRFHESDLALAEEVGRRAALAIDNARLFAERDYVARALQSSLLPPTLPAVPGVDIVARYRAAGEGNEVGGDFYDVFRSRRNAWWLVVGDVSGKGPQAAAIAGLARHTLHAVALDGRSPQRLLSSLHETLVRGEGQGEYCTVCCALLQPAAGREMRLTIACGGHPPPVIRRADGTTEDVRATGPLIGVSLPRRRFAQHSTIMRPGDTVVLYTDGVTEAHHPGGELFGAERLIDTVAGPYSDVDHLADRIMDAVASHGPDDMRDDIALLVARLHD
jgi:PAS domain S-box-containing protein